MFPLILAFYASYGSNSLFPLLSSTQREGPLTPEISAIWKLPQAGLETMPSLFLWLAYNLLLEEDLAKWVLI